MASRKRKLHEPCLFEFLPQDVLLSILESLEPVDIAHLACTNYYLEKFCKKDSIWKQLCIKEGLTEPPRSSWKNHFMTVKIQDDFFLSQVRDILRPIMHKLEKPNFEKSQITAFEAEHKIRIPRPLRLIYSHFGNLFLQFKNWHGHGLLFSPFGQQLPSCTYLLCC